MGEKRKIYTIRKFLKFTIVANLFIILFFHLLVGTIFLVSASSLLYVAHNETNVFNGIFSQQEIFTIPGELFDFSFSICPIEDSINTVISLKMPSNLISLEKGNLIWTGDVKKNEKVTLSFSMIAEQELDVTIVFNVEGTVLDELCTSRYEIRIATPKTESDSGISEVRCVSTKLANPTNYLLESEENVVASASGTITIEGRVTYLNDNNDLAPMRGVKVHLMDADTLGDDDVAWQYTDYDGRFSFTVDNDDGWGQDGRDPYIKVKSENNKALCKNGPLYTGPYEMIFPKAGDDVPDGFYHNYGSSHPTFYNEAWRAIDAVLTESDWIWNKVGWGRPKLNVYWPEGDWPSFVHFAGSTIEEIHLPQEPYDGSNYWNRFDVYHEYGHAVMYQLYGNSMPGGSGPDPHDVWSESSLGFALKEGWAEFMQCAVEFDISSMNYGSFGGLENNDWYNHVDSGDMDGDIVEGSIASILWDIFDHVIPGDRDYMQWDFDEIFTVMRRDQPDNIHEFWDAWITRWPDLTTSVGPLCVIFWHYGIDKDTYPPVGCSVAINSGDRYCTEILVDLDISSCIEAVGVRYMRIRNTATGSWSPWEDFDNAPSWLLAYNGDGIKTIWVQLKDRRGYISSVFSDTIILDREKPSGSISIDAGASSTDETTVTLYVTYSDVGSGVDKIRFKNEGGNWHIWENPPTGLFLMPYGYPRSKKWILPSGDGTKTVYYQIKDKAGQVSPIYSDTIILETPITRDALWDRLVEIILAWPTATPEEREELWEEIVEIILLWPTAP